MTALEAVREYKEIEEKKGKKIGSLAALTKSAIREGWKPRNSEVIVEEKVKTEVQDVKNVTKEIEVQKDRKKLQEDPAWLKVKAKSVRSMMKKTGRNGLLR